MIYFKIQKIITICVDVFENERIVQKGNLNEPQAILTGKQPFCMGV